MCPMSPYLLVQNVTAEVQPPATGMLTHTLLNDGSMKIMVFGFAAGHEMAAHKAPTPVTLHFLQGEATVTVGTESHEVEPGSLIHMQPEVMHGIVAKTPVTMLLYLLKAARQA
jgi:quercetin dioxygenase-like cupin family protein